MELKTIYRINSIKSEKSKITAAISFDMKHKVFDGHFPGNPIVPGVVQVQILKDLMERELKSKIFLNKTKNIKFLNVIIPVEHSEVQFDITYEQLAGNDYSVKCIVKSESTTFMKYSGNFIVTG